MLGLSKREITRRFDEIVEFAEMQDFIDAPVKTYSSGMYMRLGFAVAIHVDPDVLLVDEVLAVGDEGFTHKCLDKFAEFKRRGKTILLVTHSLPMVERFCDEALWLDAGANEGHGRSQADRRRLHHRRGSRARKRSSPPSDARAQESTVAISPDEPASAVLPDHPVETAVAPVEHVPRGRRPLGIARGGDHRRHRCRAATASAATSSTAANGSTSASASARRCRSKTSSSASACSTRKASAATAPIPTSRTTRASGCSATPRSSSRSTASISSKAPTRSTSRSTSWTAIRTTITACCTPSA